MNYVVRLELAEPREHLIGQRSREFMLGLGSRVDRANAKRRWKRLAGGSVALPHQTGHDVADSAEADDKSRSGQLRHGDRCLSFLAATRRQRVGDPVSAMRDRPRG